MRTYLIKRFLRQTINAVPTPDWIQRLARFYVHTKAGENCGDMRINGELHFLNQAAPSCRVLFDVGAYDGDWTLSALKANPAAEIHCFEPIRAHYQQLVAQSLPERVICNATALSDAPGTAPMYTKSRSLHDRRGPGSEGPRDNESELVARTTLDAYCTQMAIPVIDFLKIDTEGHDLAVLRGGAQMIRDGRVKRIQFEYGPRNIFSRVFLRDFYSFFDGLPYRICQLMPHGLAPATAYDRRLENLQYKNFVVLHQSVQV
jgi:FkbM family methyltransferase